MIAATLAVLDSVILIAAGILHVYWASGGRWGIDHAMPGFGSDPGETLLGEPAIKPKRIVTRFIGLLCFIASGLLLARVDIVSLPVQERFVEYSLWVLAGVFLLRAVGDFHSVGFTRRVTDTAFARWDAKLFTPLFLFLGMTIIIVNLFD